MKGKYAKVEEVMHLPKLSTILLKVKFDPSTFACTKLRIHERL